MTLPRSLINWSRLTCSWTCSLASCSFGPQAPRTKVRARARATSTSTYNLFFIQRLLAVFVMSVEYHRLDESIRNLSFNYGRKITILVQSIRDGSPRVNMIKFYNKFPHQFCVLDRRFFFHYNQRVRWIERPLGAQHERRKPCRILTTHADL